MRMMKIMGMMMMLVIALAIVTMMMALAVMMTMMMVMAVFAMLSWNMCCVPRKPIVEDVCLLTIDIIIISTNIIILIIIIIRTGGPSKDLKFVEEDFFMGSHGLGVRFNCYTPAYSSNCMDSHIVQCSIMTF